MPLAFQTRAILLDPVTIQRREADFRPIWGRANDERFNVDGFLNFQRSEDVSPGYCQVFRTGIVESVDAGMMFDNGEKKQIPSNEFEKRILKATTAILRGLRELGVTPPIAVLLTMLGVAGFEMAVSDRVFRRTSTPIDRDELLLPDVLIEDFECDLRQVLRPIFDAVWNAAGFSHSLNYDEEGSSS